MADSSDESLLRSYCGLLREWRSTCELFMRFFLCLASSVRVVPVPDACVPAVACVRCFSSCLLMCADMPQHALCLCLITVFCL